VDARIGVDDALEGSGEEGGRGAERRRRRLHVSDRRVQQFRAVGRVAVHVVILAKDLGDAEDPPVEGGAGVVRAVAGRDGHRVVTDKALGDGGEKGANRRGGLGGPRGHRAGDRAGVAVNGQARRQARRGEGQRVPAGVGGHGQADGPALAAVLPGQGRESDLGRGSGGFPAPRGTAGTGPASCGPTAGGTRNGGSRVISSQRRLACTTGGVGPVRWCRQTTPSPAAVVSVPTYARMSAWLLLMASSTSFRASWYLRTALDALVRALTPSDALAASIRAPIRISPF
jgi:hypothetical protein